MNLSPSDMKSLLFHILSGKEFGVEKSGESLGRAGSWCGVWPTLVSPAVENVPVLLPVQHSLCTAVVQQEAVISGVVLSKFLRIKPKSRGYP